MVDSRQVETLGINMSIRREWVQTPLTCLSHKRVENIEEMPTLKLDNIDEDYRLMLHDKKLALC